MKRHAFWIGLAAMTAIALVAVFAFDFVPFVKASASGVAVASIAAPNWYTTQYDTRVEHILQSEGFLLRGTTRQPTNVVGNKLQFFLMGRGEATTMSQAIEFVEPANLDKTTEEVEMADFQFAEWVRHGEPERISVQFRSEIQRAGAMALGRKHDRIIMVAMDDEAADIDTIGDGTTAITPIDVTTGKAEINALGMARMNEFFCPVPSMAWEQLNLYKIFNNSDYTGPDLTFKNMSSAKTWNGIHFFQMPDEAFTSPSTGVVDTYLWNKQTVGFGTNYAMKTVITYENPYTAWLYNTTMSGAAKVIQEEGVKRLRIKINDPLRIDGEP